MYRVKTFVWEMSLCILLMVGSAVHALAQNNRLQAAFILQFTRQLEWSSQGKQAGEFIIGVLGTDADITDDLKALEGRMVGQQKIAVKVFASPTKVTSCHLLYVPVSKSGLLDEVKNSCAYMLVVAEQPGAYLKGAGISFSQSSGRLNFEINTKEIQAKGLKVSSQLLRAAQAKI